MSILQTVSTNFFRILHHARKRKKFFINNFKLPTILSYFTCNFQNTGRMAAVLVGHRRYVACCAFSRDGNLLATGSNDKSIIVWDLTGNLSLYSEITRQCSPKLHWTEQPREVRRRFFKNKKIRRVRLVGFS